MISDEAVAEVAALEQARRAEYLAKQEQEQKVGALTRQIRQHSPCDQWQARALAEHLIDIGYALPAEEDDGV
jgi:hypothetical protein